ETTAPYNGKQQVWRIGVDGGEPFAVTRLDDNVGSFLLSDDGAFLYYTQASEQTDDDWKSLRSSHKSLQYGHGVTKFTQVWRLDLTTWRAEKVIDDRRVVTDMALSPDGKRMAMLTVPDDELIHKEGWSRLDVCELASRKIAIVTPDGWRKNHPSPYGWLDGVQWSGDSQAIAFTVSFDGYPARILLAEASAGGWALNQLPDTPLVSIHANTLRWKPGTRDLCFLADERARQRLFSLTNCQGGKFDDLKTLTPGDVFVSSYDWSKDGATLAAVVSTPGHMEDLYTSSPTKPWSRMSNVNPQVDTWKLPQLQLVQWQAPDGVEVEGVLELPPDYKPGQKVPLVLEIHGGPTGSSPYRLMYWIYGRTLLPAKGYAVFCPNYRGSTGYGDKFLEQLIGRENDIEVADILSGVDALVARGIADPDKLGVSGWSNGGYLTNCLIARTQRFKAASSGAGVFDFALQWGIEDTPGHVINFATGQPWEKPEEYQRGSPLFAADKITTPTLIHVGAGDERVPAAHSRMLYRTLRFYRSVPTELVIYPGEGHGLTKYNHRKAKMEWDLAWYDKYILGKTGEKPAQP
ncbi:MAG TPA: prolyl oligopeptidase family serine peptidase, partial [Planctomycetaceae bacterium]|nr:prolyl oligopeptidase family serine peptidase [Planctomycetaceae bacterium]